MPNAFHPTSEIDTDTKVKDQVGLTADKGSDNLSHIGRPCLQGTDKAVLGLHRLIACHPDRDAVDGGPCDVEGNS